MLTIKPSRFVSLSAPLVDVPSRRLRAFLAKGQNTYIMLLNTLVLVYRLLNPLSFALGQLAVFQGASDEPI